MEDQKEQDRIRRRAYELWEREGSPDGRAEEFWQRAIESLDTESSQGTGSQQADANGTSDAARSERERISEESEGPTGK
ncbi:DUF2934 domain-containing protein [Caballeronia sp. Lep1P3]|uniref:DUF2934 domain-containing protein n=1 Tax=Caballeronia sp. Lep1P3 TaxID=2878150 RepID=UPI001FD411B5|nr:DUF2934 domain-containing protein [Caballeronia sp. Lep1P3]